MTIEIQGADKVKDTSKGFATRWGVKYPEAAGLLAFLKAKGVATDTGEKIRSGESGKGKGSNVYELPAKFIVTV